MKLFLSFILSTSFFLFTVSVNGQPEVEAYFQNLNSNLSNINASEDVIMEYCKNNQTNINSLFVKDNKISIGKESYEINETVQSYYEGFQNLDYEAKCQLLYSWAEIRTTIYDISDQLNLPRELAYIPIALTALDMQYSGNYGAYGIWGLQYMPASKYGIISDSDYEQRLGLTKNSIAALSYLEELHNNFKTWDYAITAYCCGPASMVKAGYGELAFDSVYFNISNIEKDSFYRLLAITRWMQENETTDFGNVYHNLISISDTLMINSRIHFSQIAEVLNINITELKMLNPLFIGDVIDGRRIPKLIYLPCSYKDDFICLRDSIENYMDSIYFPEYTPIVNTGNSYEAYVHVSISPGDGYEEIKYKIVSGDNLGSIAEKYNVRVADIKDWNNISGTNIYAGQPISIWIKKGTVVKIEEPEAKEKPKDEVKTAANHFSMQDYKFVELYEVKPGDSPYKIALDYSWASPEDIMTWNNISDPSKLKVGQKLKIFKKR